MTVDKNHYTYALPRIITTQIQCSFGTYFWEMYTFEFGWTAAEYGKVQSLFNFTQCLFYLISAIILNIYNSNGTNDPNVIDYVKYAEILSVMIHITARKFGRVLYWPFGFTGKMVRIPIRALRNSLAARGFTHFQQPVKECISSTIASTFPTTLLNQPPRPLPQFTGRLNTPRMNAWKRFMGTRAFCVYALTILHGVGMCMFELCNKAIPVIMYPKKIIVEVEMQDVEIKINNTGSTLKLDGTTNQLDASQTYTLDVVGRKDVTATANINTAAVGVNNVINNNKNAKDLITGSQGTLATNNPRITITVPKGDGANATLKKDASSNALIPKTGTGSADKTGIVNVDTTSPDDPKYPTKSYGINSLAGTGTFVTAEDGFDIDGGNRGQAITINVLFFCVANLVVIWGFSLITYFWRNDARLAKTFLTVSLIFLGCQVPILYFFHEGIIPSDASTKLSKPEDPANTETAEVTNISITIGSTAISKEVTVDSSTVTLIKATIVTKQEAIVNRIYDDNNNNWYDRLFNILNMEKIVLLVCLTIFHSTVFFWIFTGGPLTFYVSTNILGSHEGVKAFGVPAILIGFAGATIIFALLSSLTGVSSTLAPWLFSPRFKKSVLFVCIATQFFTLWVFKPFCNDCGEPQYWKTFLVLIVTGATNTMFVTYIYIVLDDVLKTYRWNWICYGIFFSVTNFIISKAMGIMFGAFGGEGTTGFKISSINAVIGHNFPCVYKAITIFFWLANGLALLPICANSLS